MTSAAGLPSRAPSSMASVISATDSGRLSLSPRARRRRSGQEAAGLGPAGAGHEAGVDHVHVEAQIDGRGALPGNLQRRFGDLLDADPLDVADCDDRGPPTAADLDPGSRRLPASDPD